MAQISSLIFVSSFIIGIIAQLTKINLYETFLSIDSNNSIVSFYSQTLTEVTRYLIPKLELAQRPKHQKQKETLRILQLGVGHQSLCQHILSTVIERFNHQFNVVIDIIEQDHFRYQHILENLKYKCMEEYHCKQQMLFSFCDLYNSDEISFDNDENIFDSDKDSFDNDEINFNNDENSFDINNYNNEKHKETKSKQDESFQINLVFPNDYNIVYSNPDFHSYDIIISTIDEQLIEPETLSNILNWLDSITRDKYSVITRISYPYNVSWLTQILNPLKLEKIKNTISIQQSFIHNKKNNIVDIILNVPPIQITHHFSK